MESIALRTAIRGVGIALGVYVVANLIMAFLVLRPANAVESAAPPIESSPQTASVSLIADQASWQSLSGSWTFGDGGISQTQTDGYDYAYMAAAQYDHPLISVRLRHVEAVGGGIVFNVPRRDSLAGGHLVRYLDAGTLIWGYFDPAQGFTAQGTLGVPDPGDHAHTLVVTITESGYSIELDGLPIVEDVSLVSQQGYLGLTASLTHVVFEDFTVR